MNRNESRVARLKRRQQAETVTLTVVFDKNFYGNAHLLPPDAWGDDVGADSGRPHPSPLPEGPEGEEDGKDQG